MKLDCESDVFLQQSSLHTAVRSYMSMISDHYMSYDQSSMELLAIEDIVKRGYVL
jgi:hypothetical protein